MIVKLLRGEFLPLSSIDAVKTLSPTLMLISYLPLGFPSFLEPTQWATLDCQSFHSDLDNFDDGKERV